MDALFEYLWRFICNVASLVFLIWLVGLALKAMLKGGK